MLVFADSAWHVFSAFLVLLTGLWVAIVQRRIFLIGYQRAIFFYFWHTAFCLFYFSFSLTNPADSKTYYLISLTYDAGLTFGTRGIYFFTAFFSAGLGLSYGGTFFVYNILGFVGMLAFASALQEVARGTSLRKNPLILILILLPGLSFWSSAIGKDALTFMATGLATWGALNLAHRYPALVASTLAFLMARPHMAGILMAALVLALLYTSNLGLIKKMLLLMVAIPSAALAVTFGAQFAGLGDATSFGDVTEYFEARQGHNLEGGGSVDIASMSVTMRLLTYLYRPFFFDAVGLFGLLASFENLIIAIVTLSAILLRLLGRKTSLGGFALIFFVTFSVASLYVLANTTANLGIALRQKWMFLPMVLILSVSILFKAKSR